MTPAAHRSRALTVPTIALMLVALGGRYSLDRAGVAWLAWLDLRLVGLTIVAALLWHDLRRVRDPRDDVRRREGWLVVATLFWGFQIASGLWAPPGARVGTAVVDVICVALLVLGMYLHARSDPVPVARRVLWFFWATALLFAVAAFAVSGPDVQGRFAAFGGGPNVFVRIELLGVLAALALQAGRRTWWLSLSCVPLLLAALLSGSRGGLLAGAVTAGVWVAMAGRRARRAVTAALAATAVVLVVVYQAVPSVRQLVDTRFIGQTVEQGYASSRPQIWGAALRLAVEHPLVGTGIDGFYALVGTSTGTQYPHNLVLAVAAEGGLVGVTLLATAVLLWVGTLRRAVGHRSPERDAAVLATVLVAVAGLFSGDYYDARLAWLFAALAAALVAVPAGPRGDPLRPGAGTVGIDTLRVEPAPAEPVRVGAHVPQVPR